MCGIIGIAGRKPTKSKDLLTVLAHRGPDGQGEWNGRLGGKPAWFGHTRLAIVELSEAGAQPMHSRNGRWVVSFNGEIYNHMDLRKRLSGEFRGHSDTETLVEMLAQHGFEATLPLLNGMFAFAAADLEQGLLYLARDPFGVKPVYYRNKGDALAFSYEMRALRSLSPFAAEVNGEALQTFLTLRYVPSPDTLLHEVKRLPPGHWLRFSPASGGLATGCYIEPTHARFTGSFDEASEAYREVLAGAVKRQLMSDVPMG
ncbi:asparagine synthetase B, partial [bacterium]|nr:asparagine synthetase B [bacterium]